MIEIKSFETEILDDNVRCDYDNDARSNLYLNPDYAIDFVMRATSAIKYEVLRLRHSIHLPRAQKLLCGGAADGTALW